MNLTMLADVFLGKLYIFHIYLLLLRSPNDPYEMKVTKQTNDSQVQAHDPGAPLSAGSHAQRESRVASSQGRRSPLATTLAGYLIPVLGLVAIAVALLAYDSDFLFRVQELNLFLYTPLFFQQQMVVSGGFLTWVGTYFTQYFYHPWMGVSLLCLWWLLLMWLVKRTFRIPAYASVALLVPVVLLLITDVDLGYWIFYLKLRGHFFVATIGTTAAVALVWVYRLIPARWQLRNVYLLVATAVAYPLLGYYGLMAAGLMALMSWRLGGRLRDGLLGKVVSTLVALVAIVFIPLICYRYVYCQTPEAGIYSTALPVYCFFGEFPIYYLPFGLLTAVLAVLALAYGVWPDTIRRRYAAVADVVALVVLVAGTWMGWYKDKNFRRELIMTHEVENLNWDGVLQTYQTLDDDEQPTRMMWMLKNLALFRLGTAGDNMYHYKNGAAECKAPFQVRLTQTGGKIIYYHYGKLNFCYRWCLEDGVEIGWRVDYLKYMLKCAILNGEMKVAKKYIDILKDTKYYKDFAEHYEPYLTNRSLVKRDPEMKPILHFLKGPDALTSDNTLVELYLLNSFANETSNDPIYQEACLQAALQSKQIPIFWKQFSQYARLHLGQRMPIHYQEAAYLYGHLENNVDISHMPFDDEVKQNYNDFMAAAQQLEGMTEEQMKPLLYPRFGGTFYYEYFLIRGLKSY